MQTSIGFDIGRSSVKIVAAWGNQRVEVLYPSAVCAAIKIADDQEAERAAAETISVRGKDFFVGETALFQGSDDLAGGMRDDWVQTDQHTALFLAGLRKLRDQRVPGIGTASIIVGLPASLFSAQKEALQETLEPHAPGAEIRVMPQPLGPYQQMLFGRDGEQNSTFRADDSSWAVVEVGQYTTDIALILQGRVIEHSFGSCNGMRVAAENLQRSMSTKGFQVSLAEATDLLRTKVLRNFGEKVDVSADVDLAAEPLMEQIFDKANQLIGKNARALDGVLVAGGGAGFAHSALSRDWRHVRVAENPRFAVAEGFCRFSIALDRYRRQHAAHKTAPSTE